MKDNTIHMVKAAFHAQFKMAMENCGLSADAYFKKVKLPTEVIDPECLLPLKPFFYLINIVSINEDIPGFGSLVAQTTPWHEVLSLGPLIENSKSLKHLLETFCEVASSQSSLVKFSLIDEDSHYSFSYSDRPIYKGDIQMELYRLTSMIQLIQLATGEKWRPEYIRFNMPQTKAVNASPLLTKSNLAFSQTDSAISIQNDLLQLPVKLKNTGKIISDNNNHAGKNIDFADSIRNIINTYSQTNNISIEETAGIIDMSVRTLQRRLSDHGLHFNELLNDAKFAHAKTKLQDSQMPIMEIAKSLGYSDAAHFTRAFHNWSGISPTAFRNGQGNPT
jgi:AraC-like DNA-binding protein